MLKHSNHRTGRTTASRGIEICTLLFALALCNLPLLGGAPARSLAFFTGTVADGEWWRVFTWPFVHASSYHFLLDGAAFLLLYSGLESSRPAVRLLYLTAAATGSLLLPLWVAPEIRSVGLCGLSGVAHGLLAVTALELLSRHPRGSTLFRTGALLLAGVLLKSVLEVATGEVLLAGLHLGPVGHPVPSTHAGGTLGGAAAFALTEWTKHLRAGMDHHE